MYPLPGRHAEAVTPSDTALNEYAYLLVVETGDVTVEPSSGGANVTYTAVPAYTYLWGHTKRVLDTGTDDIDIIGYQ
jgi:hypothetical protein